MANGKTHMMAGGAVGLGLYVAHHKFIHNNELTLNGIVGSFCFGAISGAMADKLEPATSPYHRQFFHSITFAAIAFFGKERVCQSLNLTEDEQRYLDWFIASYGSHLFLDAQTPMGLPII